MLSRRALSRVPKSLLVRLNSSAAPPAKTPAQEARLASSNPPQAPNFVGTWTTSQAPRPAPGSSPRFEQAIMETQPAPPSAMQMIAEEPIRLVEGRKAVCDGGSGPLGHPKIFINLDQPGPRACGYCGIRFQQDPAHHHHH
ncbi:zinc-finger domain-containing protein [Schizophyllum amplum]|uniref:Zinc-finger domain-containing protein n=1 Tax=Schizophyllum amplum TaxID=97359 RepID=A0A550CND0_9AGAR|nr:zinc-finger domain-containing protein [Auriculariopsis ampla]TRM66302.1 zinc-finger domain-containing protein [Auriculariopsis ampla]